MAFASREAGEVSPIASCRFQFDARTFDLLLSNSRVFKKAGFHQMKLGFRVNSRLDLVSAWWFLRLENQQDNRFIGYHLTTSQIEEVVN